MKENLLHAWSNQMHCVLTTSKVARRKRYCKSFESCMSWYCNAVTCFADRKPQAIWQKSTYSLSTVPKRSRTCKSRQVTYLKVADDLSSTLSEWCGHFVCALCYLLKICDCRSQPWLNLKGECAEVYAQHMHDCKSRLSMYNAAHGCLYYCMFSFVCAHAWLQRLLCSLLQIYHLPTINLQPKE